MKEQLQQETLIAFKELLTTVSQAKDFVLSELPEVIHQLLMWEFVQSIITNTVLVLLWVAFTLIIMKVLKKPEEGVDNEIYNWSHTRSKHEHKDLGFTSFFTFLASIPLLLITVFNLNIVWLKIWIAPKVFLIEYAAGIIN